MFKLDWDEKIKEWKSLAFICRWRTAAFCGPNCNPSDSVGLAAIRILDAYLLILRLSNKGRKMTKYHCSGRSIRDLIPLVNRNPSMHNPSDLFIAIMVTPVIRVGRVWTTGFFDFAVWLPSFLKRDSGCGEGTSRKIADWPFFSVPFLHSYFSKPPCSPGALLRSVLDLDQNCNRPKQYSKSLPSWKQNSLAAWRLLLRIDFKPFALFWVPVLNTSLLTANFSSAAS